MEFIICPACSKKIKNLKLHYRASHPDLDVPDLRNLEPAAGPEQSEEQPESVAQESPIEQPKQEPAAAPSDLLQKLQASGISPKDIMAALGPLVETSVVQTLEKMQLGEGINKKMAEVEAKLGEKIQPLVEMGQQLQGGQAPGNGSPPPAQNEALMNQVLPMLLQKFLNPKSDGGSVNLESMTKTLETARTFSDIFSKPFLEGQEAARREMNETIRLMSGLGATPEQKRKTLGARTEVQDG